MTPRLVAQIGFAEWTTDGRLRQPRFMGLRDDKRPADVAERDVILLDPDAAEPGRRHHLPQHPRGYYHEYTVPTPGVRTRGARRIICGGPRQSPAVCYYTDDHYASFRRIRE